MFAYHETSVFPMYVTPPYCGELPVLDPASAYTGTKAPPDIFLQKASVQLAKRYIADS